MSYPPNFSPGRRLSKAYMPPKIELVQEDDGKHAYNCTPHSSFDDSDSATSGLSRRGGGGKHTRKLREKLLMEGFMFAGGAVAAVLLILACLTFLLGDWVLTEFAELLGFFALLGSAYFASSILYSLWATQCTHSVPLDSRAVILLAGSYAVGAACCNLLNLFFPSLPMKATLLVLLAGWLSATNAYLHKDAATPDWFFQKPENYLFVAATLVHRVVLQTMFHAFIPSILLPLIVHSCNLFGLTVAMVIRGRVSRLAAKKVSLSAVSKRRPSLRSSILYPPPHRAGVRHSSMERRNSWTSVSSFGSSRFTQSDTDLVEARGILDDLMLEQGLDSKTRQRLEQVHSLLTPSTQTNTPILTRMKSLPHNTVDIGGQDDQRDTPVFTHKSSVFAVGTSSTGMPLLPDSPFTRPRAPARNEFLRPHLKEEKTRPPTLQRPSLPVLGRVVQRPSSAVDLRNVGPSPLVVSRSYSSLEKELEKESRQLQSKEDENGAEPVFASDDVKVMYSDAVTTPTTPQVVVLGDEDKQPTSFQATTCGSGSNAPPPEAETLGPPSSKSSIDSVTNQMHKVSLSSVGDLHERKFSSEHAMMKKYSIFSKFQVPDLLYDISSYSECSIEMIEDIGTWDFPIFRFTEEAKGHPLSQMAYQVFMEMGLMETFHIPPRPFINFFRALELNYGVGPYHNNRHAADVLHATFYLLTEPIPEFDHLFQESSSATRVRPDSRKYSSVSGCLASAFSVLEVLGCLLAAACHDFDHPGRTNAFLTATKNPLSILYNDRSVLENHHAAGSWEMLTTEPEMSFLEGLDPTEYKRLRFLFIECILATDLKMHFGMLGELKNKYVQNSNPIAWQSEEERMGIMKMVIKMADINGPSKCQELHMLWTECITEEFYQQDEEERQLSLPSTMFLQRGANPEQLPKVQLSFVQNLVAPLFHVCAQMGIIPGEVSYMRRSPSSVSRTEEPRVSDGESTTAVTGPESYTSDEDDTEGQVRKFTSFILDNLQSNIDSWQAKLDAVVAGQSKEAEVDTPSIEVEDADVQDGDVEDNVDHDPDA